MAWRAGAAVVFPSATYDASAIVDALNNLPCTHISCTPSVMFSLMSQPQFSKNGYENLQSVAMGAELVTKDLIERCYEAFKLKKVINGWGMTEGISKLGAELEEPAAWRDGILSIGHVIPNSNIRICDPESMQVVGNDAVGELHVSGLTVISGYYSKGELYQTDSFYQENDKTWFKTGDSVVMDKQGYVYFEGRYKDLIVRGGENVNPSIIEACLSKIPGVEVRPNRDDVRPTVDANTSQSQVVGDILVILRFCYHAEQEVGSRITAANVLEHETPSQQAVYLEQKSGSSRDSKQSIED